MLVKMDVSPTSCRMMPLPVQASLILRENASELMDARRDPYRDCNSLTPLSARLCQSELTFI